MPMEIGMIRSKQQMSDSADSRTRLTWTVFTCLVVGSSLLSIAADAAYAASDVPSGMRAALLIGNSTYDGFNLDGVAKSLDVVEAALTNQGFRELRRENVGEKDW